MPELRSRPRRNRASNRNPKPDHNNDNNNNPIGNPIAEQRQEQEPPRDLTDARPRRGRGRRPAQGNNRGKTNAIGGAIRETTLVKREEEEEDRVLREGVGERGMDEYDSGGRSGDKGAAAEDEGSTAPLPEKVVFFFFGV